MKLFTNLSSSPLIFSLVILALYGSCKKHDPDLVVKGETKVKMVNAVQTESNQNIFVDGEKISTAALAFSESTNYLKIYSGSRNVKFMGENNTQTEFSLSYTPSITYTTFLVSDRSGVREIISYEDNLSNTETGKAKIKLINLSPYFSTGLNVSVQAGTQFVNGLLYKEASSYFSVEAGLNLRYNVVGSATVKTIDGTSLLAGKIYTIWFSGISAGTLEAHVITDN